MPSVVIADDHGLYRRGLRIALQEALTGATFHEVDSLDGVMGLLDGDTPIDLALLDLTMPGLNSLADLRELRISYPWTRFIVLSARDTSDVVLGTLAAGLHGYISKSQPDSEILGAINDIMSGRIYVPPWLAQLSSPAVDRNTSKEAPRSAQAANLARLTPRQRDVLALIAEGLSNKEIGEHLSIAETTTKIHVAALMRALGVRNRTEAAVLLKTWVDGRNFADP